MKNATEYRNHRVFRAMVLFLVVVWSFQAAPEVKALEVDAVRQAISRLEHFQNDVKSMRAVVEKPLGPYKLHTKCTWCIEKAWWGIGFCTKNRTETWNANVDFSYTRKGLQQVLQKADQNAATFLKSYEPTQQWINSLPEFSTNFNRTADVILSIQQDIKAGNGPTDQQQITVTQALEQLMADLQNSSEQLKRGISALSASLQKQSAYREAIKKAIGGADQSANAALTRLRNQSKTHHCQGGLNEKFAQIRADFDRSIQEISAAFQRLEVSSHAAEKDIAFLLGSIVTDQTQLQNVLNLLKAAKKDQLGSFIEKLHLSAAIKQWEAIAQ
nr:hypothetical protein [uncultured Desulfobacter sp.]